tara:strand:- start:573 stop:821 length:249 start_codon:yes stop_codon:yes gene_type:complete
MPNSFWAYTQTNRDMASSSKKKNVTVYLIPEGETRDSHTYHYTAVKTKTLTQENRKLKMKKYNPVKRKHEMFVEAKLPKHQK